MDAKRQKLEGQNDSGDGVGDANKIPIRTLWVGPVEADMDNDQIKRYFEQFGTVNSVDDEQEDDSRTHFALVEFKLVETAAAVLLSNGMHRINGCDVQVKAAEPWQQPDHILNALDDHCLRMILLPLNQLDLTNAANTCVRFNQQAKSVFSTKIKKLELNIINGITVEVKNTLQTFGSLAQSIYANGCSKHVFCEHENQILSMMDRCCTSAFKELTLHNFYFESEMLSNVTFNLALSKLERLSLKNCNLGKSCINLMSSCTELKVVHMNNCWFVDQNLVPKFEKLEELRLEYNGFSANRILNGFINSKSKITKFAMRSIIAHENLPDITHNIVRNLPNLLELELRVHTDTDIEFVESFGCLVLLTSLKVLKLYLCLKSTAPLAAVLQSNAMTLEHLELINGIIDSDTIKAISQMEQLKVLELRNIDGLTDEHTTQLAIRLGSRLEKLVLKGFTGRRLTTIGLKKMLPFATKLSLLTVDSWTITIDADDYKAMLDAVQKRPEKTSLLLKLFGQKGQIKVNEKVLMENRRIFYIDHQIDSDQILY